MYLRPGLKQREILHLGIVRDLRDHQKRVHRLRVWGKIQFGTVSRIHTRSLSVSHADPNAY